ncbi:dihydropteroate synthase [bacterium]|jgi:dihydropteroate synthase|nr:dihydropteroate synthase [Verrucomicrobiota bacterium]MDA7510660.1 dihydropteroate synthase [Verrucomicrobiota bacterium]MDA7633452.1 dihydropteroate synthase [bacterium]MDB4796860.1 dihydropteroate synthase [bacterium]
MLNLEWLASLLAEHQDAANSSVDRFTVGKNGLEIGDSPKIMGVINLSHQSWYRESVCLSESAAIRRGKLLQAQGADFIDIGGESTLAHADRVTEDGQTRILTPIIKELVANHITVSIETYSAKVTQAALEAGASIINMTGTGESDLIYELAAAAEAAVIVSYVQGQNPREVDTLQFKSDPYIQFQEYFRKEIDKAAEKSLHRIIIDPGLGFYYKNLSDGAERVRYQMETLLQTFRLYNLGKPVCHALPHAFEFFESDVRSAEPFFAILAALGKTNVFRTHEVSQTKAVLNTLSCIGPSHTEAECR